MRKNFLVGNFLPAYSDVFRYRDSGARRDSGLDADRLEQRFTERADRHRTRRRDHLVRLQFGLVVALTLAVAAFQVDLLPGSNDLQVDLQEQELVAMEDILQTRQFEQPPPPPRPPVPVEVPDDISLSDEDFDFDATLDLDVAVAILPPPPPEVVERLPEIEEPEVFVAVEEMPVLIGGTAAVARMVKYPELARKAGLEGTVIVQVVVNADGTPSDPVVARSVATILDEAAVEAVLKQRWKPGRQRGRAVRVLFTVPVVFRLT